MEMDEYMKLIVTTTAALLSGDSGLFKSADHTECHKLIKFATINAAIIIEEAAERAELWALKNRKLFMA